MLHELEDNEDLIIVVVQFDALDHLIALKVFSETCLVDGNLLFCRCDVLEMLHREQFAIRCTLDLVDDAEATLSNRFHSFVVD